MVKFDLQGGRAPTSYKCGYNRHKWPYKWSYKWLQVDLVQFTLLITIIRAHLVGEVLNSPTRNLKLGIKTLYDPPEVKDPWVSLV